MRRKRKKRTIVTDVMRKDVLQLLRTTPLSYSQIASRTGISKESVGNIARRAGWVLSKRPVVKRGETPTEPRYREENKKRCAVCGHFIYTKRCLICAAREYIARKQSKCH